MESKKSKIINGINETELAEERRDWLLNYCRIKSEVVKGLTNLSVFWSNDYSRIRSNWKDSEIESIGRSIQECILKGETGDYLLCPFCYYHSPYHANPGGMCECKDCSYGLEHGFCAGLSKNNTYDEIVKRLKTHTGNSNNLCIDEVMESIRKFVKENPFPVYVIKDKPKVKDLVDLLEVGMPIFSVVNGWGIVVNLTKSSKYPIEIKCKNSNGQEAKDTFTKDGKLLPSHKRRALFIIPDGAIDSLKKEPTTKVKMYKWVIKKCSNGEYAISSFYYKSVNHFHETFSKGDYDVISRIDGSMKYVIEE